VKYYKPEAKSLESYIALWAGQTLCVIDRLNRTMLCIERNDEIHRIHACTDVMWIVEGELSVDLFDPRKARAVANYNHGEVITGCIVRNGLIELRDYYGSTVILDPGHLLRVVHA
jgi:hypothetical protein